MVHHQVLDFYFFIAFVRCRKQLENAPDMIILLSGANCPVSTIQIIFFLHRTIIMSGINVRCRNRNLLFIAPDKNYCPVHFLEKINFASDMGEKSTGLSGASAGSSCA